MRSASLSKRVLRFLSLVLLLGGGAALGGCAGAKGGPAESPASANADGSGSAPAGYPEAQSTESTASVKSESSTSSMAPTSPMSAPPPRAPTSSGSSSSASSSPAKPAPQPQPSLAPPPPPADAKKSTARADSSTPPANQAAPEPSTRPGLGTEFGESRVSHVHDVAFVRDSSRPFAISAMSYNDKKGVDALVASASRHETTRSLSAASGAVTISIRDASGNALEASHVGERTFVVGQAGQRYSIVLENHTSHRFEAVGTVDGLDVINGKAGTFDNRGYVLLPFATLTIDGFRTSTSSVAAFRFATVSDSYAAQTGSARNVGVIGMAFFSERGDAFVPESETRLRETASPFPADPRFAQPPPGR